MYTRASTLIYGSDFDLKLNEWRVLAAIMSHDDFSVSLACLVQETGLDYGLASRLAGSLVKKKLAIRKPGPRDARSRIVQLTEKGRSTASQVLAVACERSRSLMRDLSPEEIVLLDKVMESLIQRAESMLAEEQARRREKLPGQGSQST